jgi:hypothetical protein
MNSQKISENVTRVCELIIDTLGNRGGVLVKHEPKFDLQGIVEVARVEVDELLGFVEAVNQGVAVNVELLGSLGEVQSRSRGMLARS